MDEVMNGAEASAVFDETQGTDVAESTVENLADAPDVERMTNLMIQEMAGVTESGVTENVAFKEAETTVDPLLWSA